METEWQATALQIRRNDIAITICSLDDSPLTLGRYLTLPDGFIEADL